MLTTQNCVRTVNGLSKKQKARQIISTCIIYVQLCEQKHKIAFMCAATDRAAKPREATTWPSSGLSSISTIENSFPIFFFFRCVYFFLLLWPGWIVINAKCHWFILGYLQFAFAFIMFECVKQSTHAHAVERESNSNLVETHQRTTYVRITFTLINTMSQQIFYSLFHFGNSD